MLTFFQKLFWLALIRLLFTPEIGVFFFFFFVPLPLSNVLFCSLLSFFTCICSARRPEGGHSLPVINHGGYSPYHL